MPCLRGLEPLAVRKTIRLSGVAPAHDLHIWAMYTTEMALTAHLVMPPDTLAMRSYADL